MKVRELKQMLEYCKDDVQVVIFDPHSEGLQPVTNIYLLPNHEGVELIHDDSRRS